MRDRRWRPRCVGRRPLENCGQSHPVRHQRYGQLVKKVVLCGGDTTHAKSRLLHYYPGMLVRGRARRCRHLVTRVVQRSWRIFDQHIHNFHANTFFNNFNCTQNRCALKSFMVVTWGTVHFVKLRRWDMHWDGKYKASFLSTGFRDSRARTNTQRLLTHSARTGFPVLGTNCLLQTSISTIGTSRRRTRS